MSKENEENKAIISFSQNVFLLFFFCTAQKKNEKNARLIFIFLKSTGFVLRAAQAALLHKCSVDSFLHPLYKPLDLLPK